MDLPLRLVALLALSAFPAAARQSPSSQSNAPFVPLEVLSAKSIAVTVYWPDAGWRDKAEVQGDGEAFLRKWKRYRVVRISESPDLIALVTVEPTSRSAGFWRTLAYAMAIGAQAYARSAQNYERCQGPANGGEINLTCYGYATGAPSAPPPPPAPNYVLGGTIMVFDGTFLRTGAPIPEPVMFAEADKRGNMPLIGAAKRLRQMVEQAEKVEPDRMAAVIQTQVGTIRSTATAGTQTQAGTNAEVEVASTPSGADIELDGSFVGSTPSTIGVPGGEHLISVKKNGYKPWERKIKTSTGKVTIAADLEAEVKREQRTEAAVTVQASSDLAETPLVTPAETLGTISLTSSPYGAEIYSDSLFVGKTPATLKLKPGQHSIRMFMNDYNNWSQWITVEPGSETHITATLKKSN
jgi:hypothetical protein